MRACAALAVSATLRAAASGGDIWESKEGDAIGGVNPALQVELALGAGVFFDSGFFEGVVAARGQADGAVA